MYVSHSQALDYLSAPVLEEIAIRIRKSDEIRSHLERFVIRSSCLLRRLCLAGSPNAQSTEEILQHYPSITELAIIIANNEDEDAEHSIHYPLYLKMLDSRWSAHDCALKAAELLLPNPRAHVDPESLAKMGMLREAGMRFSFLSGEIAQDRADQWLHISTWP
ncbi:hypothetical protein B0H12DRAFT_1069778 [Mycena haematopus]|nr:hypothetical protein B0H12DRAFT_1069778 [Mycena haematopus]